SAGQSCEARSRILVGSSIYDDFVTSFSEAAGRLKLGDPLDPETQVGSLISEEHRDKGHGFVEQGRGAGVEGRGGGAAGAAGRAARRSTAGVRSIRRRCLPTSTTRWALRRRRSLAPS